VLQVQYSVYSTDLSVTSSSYTDVVTVSITPTYSNSTIVLLATLRAQNPNTPSWWAARLYNKTAGSNVAPASDGSYFVYNGSGNTIIITPLNYVTTSGSTTARTYALQVASHDGQGTAVNPNGYPSSLIVMEIAP
jgi:hypothetical protein